MIVSQSQSSFSKISTFLYGSKSIRHNFVPFPFPETFVYGTFIFPAFSKYFLSKSSSKIRSFFIVPIWLYLMSYGTFELQKLGRLFL